MFPLAKVDGCEWRQRSVHERTPVVTRHTDALVSGVVEGLEFLNLVPKGLSEPRLRKINHRGNAPRRTNVPLDIELVEVVGWTSDHRVLSERVGLLTSLSDVRPSGSRSKSSSSVVIAVAQQPSLILRAAVSTTKVDPVDTTGLMHLQVTGLV